MNNGQKDYSRDYSAIQNAGQNLVQNRGYSAYKYNRNPQDYNYGFNRNVKTNQYSNETSRYDELDILDQFSQPLLQKQGGDVMGNISSIQMGQNKRNDFPQIRGSSANPRNIIPYNRNPYPPQPPQPTFHQYPQQMYQQPPPYGYFNPKQEQTDQVTKLLQQQLDKQNDILSQLANNLDKSRHAQMNQQSQPPQPNQSQKLRDIEKEYEMMNEIQNLRREIGSIVNQKNQINPLIQQQQQQFQMMQMQQMMMNPYMNPMMMMLMNQMNQQNPQPPPQPFQNAYPPFSPFQNPTPVPQQNKYNSENRVEELLKQLLKEKTLNNMQQNQQIPQYQDNRFNYQNRIPSRQPYSNQNNQQINMSEPSEYIQNQYQPMQNMQPSHISRTQQSDLKQRKVDTSRFRKKICKVVLFLRWLKLEVIKSKQQFKQYEIEEFSSDYLKAQQDALPWLISSSTKAFSQIVTNCKQEQDITDLVVKKLNAKEQELRFNSYTEDCNTIIDEMTKTIDNIPESVSLFIVKKFYDNSYFSNNPQFLFEYEIDRLEFDKTDQKLINIDNFPDSPRFKMLLLIYIFIKIYLPSILIKPWDQQLDPSIRMIENYITTKKFSLLCSIMYHQIMDYLKINVPLVQKKPNEITWASMPKTQVINNSKQIQLQPLNSTKEELLTLAVNKDQLSTFYSKKQQWIEQFRQKLDLYAKTVRKKLQQQRVAYLEIRKELLQDKAKELQRIIPQNLRNVQIKN